jgi:hypothetical protein
MEMELTKRIYQKINWEDISSQFTPFEFLFCGLKFINETEDFDEIHALYEKIMDTEKHYVSVWENLIPIIQKNFPHINYEKILFGLYNFKPGKINENFSNILENFYLQIFSFEINNIPKEQLMYIEKEFGLPNSWQTYFSKSKFILDLENFSDNQDSIKAFIAKYSIEDFNSSEKKELQSKLINIGESSCISSEKLLNFFIEVVDWAAPKPDPFRPNQKAYVQNIFCTFNGDQNMMRIITEHYYNIDFDMPYTQIVNASVKAEANHISKMIEKFPNYRHD